MRQLIYENSGYWVEEFVILSMWITNPTGKNESPNFNQTQWNGPLPRGGPMEHKLELS